MIEMVVIGASAGGLEALRIILPALPQNFNPSIAIVNHIAEIAFSCLASSFSDDCALPVKEAESGEVIKSGTVYFAPAGYHLLVDLGKTFSLSVDPRVNYSCPSIDVLFESAADVFGIALMGVILTGANADGSRGLKTIKNKGGLTLVQNPDTAKHITMPRAALDEVRADYIAELNNIAPLLIKLCGIQEEKNYG